jgi:hypothetical protein
MDYHNTIEKINNTSYFNNSQSLLNYCRKMIQKVFWFFDFGHLFLSIFEKDRFTFEKISIM